MDKVSESIFSGKDGIVTFVIPMADVQYIKKEEWGHGVGRIRIAYEVYLSKRVVKLPHYTGKSFMKAWCYYRHELEGGTKGFKIPEDVENKVCPTCKLEWKLSECFIDERGLEHCPNCGHIELEDKEQNAR